MSNKPAPADLQQYMANVGQAARLAAGQMAAAPTAAKSAALLALARRLRAQGAALLSANTKDLDAAIAAGLDAPVARASRRGRRGVECLGAAGGLQPAAVRAALPDTRDAAIVISTLAFVVIAPLWLMGLARV